LAGGGLSSGLLGGRRPAQPLLPGGDPTQAAEIAQELRGTGQGGGVTLSSPQRKLGSRAARVSLLAYDPSFRWDDDASSSLRIRTSGTGTPSTISVTSSIGR